MSKRKIKEALINTAQMIGAPSVGAKNYPTVVFVPKKKFPFVKAMSGRKYYLSTLKN